MPKVSNTARVPTAPTQRTDINTEPGAAVDSSQWRKSTIRVSTTITKTKAKTEYHLNDEDLNALAFVNADHHVTRINRTVNKRLYKRREVEQKAWEKHGGPDGFDAYVRRLKHNRFKRAHAKPIPQPLTSNPAASTHVAQPLPGPSRDSRSWVLEACNKALDWHDRTYSNPYEGSFPLYNSPRARANPMQEALRFQATYPLSRTTVPLPSSPTIDALRAILADAPRLAKEQAHSFEPIPVLGIDATHHSWPEEDYSYEWATWYLNSLFTALCNVITVHGTGEAGWLSIRWEVYDKYAECIGGISYDRKDGWADRAAHWLDGAYPLDDPRNIAFAFSSRSKSVQTGPTSGADRLSLSRSSGSKLVLLQHSSAFADDDAIVKAEQSTPGMAQL
ncbi:hypothetical protein VTO73DRAFT_12859 [Trametes versicolor]